MGKDLLLALFLFDLFPNKANICTPWKFAKIYWGTFCI